MEEDLKSLRKTLARIRSRRIAVRWVLLSGRALLLVSFLLLAIVVFRRAWVLSTGEDPIGMGAATLVISAAGLILAIPLLVRLGLLVGRPTLDRVARTVDRRIESRDLLSAGLAASRTRRGFAGAVLARAARRASELSPDRLFPARRSIAKCLAVLPLALAAVYLLGLPGGEGMLPSGIAAESDVASGDPGAPTKPESNEPEALDPPPDDGVDDPAAEEEKNDPEEQTGGLIVRVVPAKRVFAPDEAVLLFITIDGDEQLDGPITLSPGLLLDGAAAGLGEALTIEPGPSGGKLLTVDARQIPGLREKLNPGVHQVAAVATAEGRTFASEFEEFRIEGDDGGGEGESEKPEGGADEKPEPDGGAPPPPALEDKPQFVAPLAREGETERKRGYALVRDPEAPAGAPPERLPLSQAPAKAARRAESAVPTERLSDADRKIVSRYFDLLREGR